jgi:hypothetical protein
MAQSIDHQVALFLIYFHNNRHRGNVSKGICGDRGRNKNLCGLLVARGPNVLQQLFSIPLFPHLPYLTWYIDKHRSCHSVLILRFLPILLVVIIAVLLARRAMSQKETVESNAADMTPLLLALSGLIGLFVLFVGVTEFITRM